MPIHEMTPAFYVFVCFEKKHCSFSDFKWQQHTNPRLKALIPTRKPLNHSAQCTFSTEDLHGLLSGLIVEESFHGRHLGNSELLFLIWHSSQAG